MMDNFHPKAEVIKEKPVFHNVLSLTEVEREVLKSRIIESQGVVRIMIHPYYVRQFSSRRDDREYIIRLKGPRVSVVEEGFERMLKAKSSVPIFLFEGEENLSETKLRINKILQESGNELYLVPTYDASPVPVSFKDVSRGEEWNFFVDTMKDLGAKRLIIGGMYLFKNEYIGSRENSEELKGCVGVAINALSSHFDIQTSSITHPLSRKDIMNPDTKKYEKN